MKKLLSKFTAIYIVVLFLGYIFMTMGVNHFLTRSLVDQRVDDLISNARAFQESFEDIEEAHLTPVERISMLRKEIKALDKYTGADIWLIDSQGSYVAVSNDILQGMDLSMLTENDWNTVFAGNILVKETSMQGVYSDQVLMVAYPFKIDEHVQTAMFMNVMMPEIEKATFNITGQVFLSMSGIVLIATVVLFSFTRQINREYKELNHAVKEVASGNFDQQIRINRDDELGELAKSFNYMSRELRKLENTKQRFISNLSHDLRSPLTSITGYICAIQDGTIPVENQERYLNIVLSESERLKKLVNDILELSKMQSGQITVNKTDFDINQMVLEELDRFESRIIDKHLKLHINLSDEKVLAHADENAMRRVVYNLLDNALKFINHEGDLRVKSELKGDKYIIGIQNSGAVIPKDKLDTIWDRFNKLDDSRGREKDSSGLGLAIIKEIIRAHEEKIEVYSDEKVGVMFVFSVETQIFKRS
ncbi:sensor histidine kinase [Fusibacter sp. JL216-2]|uniref:sensor histidine kinase n=1 Tax=Fusibacter sp. JL216-2 TaxID=3071453 RepID=UPI003D32D198